MSLKNHTYILIGIAVYQVCKVLTNYLSDNLSKRSPIFFIYYEAAFDSLKIFVNLSLSQFYHQKERQIKVPILKYMYNCPHL